MTDEKSPDPDEEPRSSSEADDEDAPDRSEDQPAESPEDDSEEDDSEEDDSEEGDSEEDEDSGDDELAPASARSGKPSVGFFVTVTATNFILDQATKWWAVANLEHATTRDDAQRIIVADHVRLVFAKNKGGAWGILQDQDDWLRIPFFLLISVAAIWFILSLYRRLEPRQTALKWGLPLVFGGALGNFVDRLRLGYVIDFVDVYLKMDGKEEHWPTFNVADVAIVAGVALMAIDMFTSRPPSKAAKEPTLKELLPKDGAGAKGEGPELTGAGKSKSPAPVRRRAAEDEAGS